VTEHQANGAMGERAVVEVAMGVRDLRLD